MGRRNLAAQAVFGSRRNSDDGQRTSTGHAAHDCLISIYDGDDGAFTYCLPRQLAYLTQFRRWCYCAHFISAPRQQAVDV